MPRLRWSLRQWAVRENQPKLIYLNVKIPTSWGGSKVGPTWETFRKPGLPTVGCITNPDLEDLCLQIIHTRSALHISFDVCKRGIVPGAQKLTWSLGKFSIGFARVSLRGKARTAFSCPLLVQPSKCGSESTAGNEEAEKNGTFFFFQGICTWSIWQSWSVFMAQKGGVIFVLFCFVFF